MLLFSYISLVIFRKYFSEGTVIFLNGLLSSSGTGNLPIHPFTSSGFSEIIFFLQMHENMDYDIYFLILSVFLLLPLL